MFAWTQTGVHFIFELLIMLLFKRFLYFVLTRIHHWTEDGGQLTITNSNSNWGGCAALSEGYNDSSFTADTNWILVGLKLLIT